MADEQVIQKAQSMGWIPKDQFRGPEEKWVDADVFVERGEQIMPILRKHNKDLQTKVETLNNQVTTLQTAITASQEAIDGLKTFHAENVKEKVAQARANLMAEIKQARTDGNIDAELEANNELQQLNLAEVESAKKPKLNDADLTTKVKLTPEQEQAQRTAETEFNAWRTEVAPWYGTDEDKTAVAIAMGNKLRAKGETVTGRAFLDKVVAEVEKVLQGNPRMRTSKVGEDSRQSGSSGGDGHSYSDLPQEAKAQVAKQAGKMVGEGRAFKTLPEWQNYYAQVFFEEA